MSLKSSNSKIGLF